MFGTIRDISAVFSRIRRSSLRFDISRAFSAEFVFSKFIPIFVFLKNLRTPGIIIFDSIELIVE